MVLVCNMIDSEDKIINIDIDKEMRTAYIDYAMSVIVSRALPDVRDGFKPVHRRVLYAMNDTGNVHSSPHKKSAKTVGEVIAKYHPHGDSSVYFTLVRLAQPWNLRYTMVDGQGNFGSIDGDSPAAMRYTEARLSRIAAEMLRDIDKETVDFQNNFDDTLQEPVVLPTRIPNLLVNGAAGIAVGMATNMPPHNLGESIDGCVAYIDADGEIEISELMKYVKAPDFPTGGLIYGYAGVKEAFETGRGRIVIRSRCEIEQHANHERIIVTEIPYQVVKSDLVASIAQLVNEKKIDGISDIRDESNRQGIRVVIEIKRDANASVVLNKLYKQTALQSSFSVNNIALVNGRPMLLNLKDLIREFVDHRHDVVTRRCIYELRKAKERAHILEGLLIAVDHIDEVIAIIRAAKDPNEAMANLIARFELSEIQARAIVDMRLRALTGLEREKLRNEYEEIARQIAYLEMLLGSKEERMKVVKQELLEVREKYADDRRSEIIYASEEFNPEDFYADDEMIITLSHMGYIKRTPLTEFRTQSRGGVGAKGSDTRSEDFVEYIYSASMHATILLFTAKGKCYWLKVYEIPEGAKNAKGRAIQNLLNIDPDDKVTAFIRIKDLTKDEAFVNSHYLMFATKTGMVKKTLLEAYSRPRTNGVIAINLNEGDEVVSVRLTNGRNQILIANRNGRAVRFDESTVRTVGRNSIGVRGMRLDEDGQDEVIGMIAIKHPEEQTVLVVSEHGYGKRSSIEDYRTTNRGGKGVKTMQVTDKTGHLIDIRAVEEDNDLMIINKSGVAIRISVKDIAVIGRATQGVRLINLDKRGDDIASVCSVISEEEMAEAETPKGEGVTSLSTTDADTTAEDDIIVES
ncbi:DNA gyrase subunit A [Porphyromonas crevioricanis JCM 15906]|uniref:DNA gyrase subunit A n=3 Tax=Porphyromonas crevioricanis TaxID=393921 RepID=A0A2X4SDS7_9PORP|nr:DNA gyrase subunit A [Porphyromonas crevioricanis JCM 15906]GAD07249.1 DNA gyrase subunit A [Porphyromonas crevioricanis JCM 13913]SJZ68306.1 DNA gyrase subunit A [Porphyromonas crevioricanis]SQH72202.1 DNA gyrase subunit A [Porphyromonas crevioricanis]